MTLCSGPEIIRVHLQKRKKREKVARESSKAYSLYYTTLKKPNECIAAAAVKLKHGFREKINRETALTFDL